MALTDTSTTKEFFSNRGWTSGSNLVSVVTHSVDDTRSYIFTRESFGCTNLDTDQVTVVLSISGSTGLQDIERTTLLPGERWTNTTEVGVFPGEHLFVSLESPVTTEENSWTIVYFQVTD